MMYAIQYQNDEGDNVITLTPIKEKAIDMANSYACTGSPVTVYERYDNRTYIEIYSI